MAIAGVASFSTSQQQPATNQPSEKAEKKPSCFGRLWKAIKKVFNSPVLPATLIFVGTGMIVASAVVAVTSPVGWIPAVGIGVGGALLVGAGYVISLLQDYKKRPEPQPPAETTAPTAPPVEPESAGNRGKATRL